MTSTPDPAAPVTDPVLHSTTELGISAAIAFDYFTEPELLTQWLTAAANVDRGVGGRYELFWMPDDPKNNSTMGCKITAWAPGELLAFHWKSPAQFKAFANVVDPLTHVVVTFITHDRGCRVHLVHSGWRSSPEWDQARLWQARAWSVAFDQWRSLLSAET